LNLSLTHYGQQAMMIDTNGGLARLDKGKGITASVLWAGTAKE